MYTNKWCPVWVCGVVFTIGCYQAPLTHEAEDRRVQLRPKDSKEIVTPHEAVRVYEAKPMRTLLEQKGEEADYTSEVFHIQLEDSSEWVLKYEVDNPLPQGAIAEVLAYKISACLGLSLVPETQLVRCQGQIGTMQRYVGDTLSKAHYGKILQKGGHEAIQRLKLFWFIVGQSDVCESNVLFKIDGTPVAIDNASILTPQSISCYGQIPFVDIGPCIQPDQGSVNQPLVLEGRGNDVLEALKQLMGNAVPHVLQERFPKRKWINFIYFAKDGRIFRQYPNAGSEWSYVLQRCSQEVLQQFDQLNQVTVEAIFVNIAEELSVLSEQLDLCPAQSVQELLAKLKEQFCEGVIYRKGLVFKHFARCLVPERTGLDRHEIGY